MFSAGLHAFGRDGPDIRSNLGEGGPAHLPGPRSGQDRKFQRSGCNTLDAAQCFHEFAYVGKRQGGVMFDTSHLSFRWQDRLQVTLPASWVLAAAVAVSARPIEH